MGHRAVPHTADLAVEAWADSREECLAEAQRLLAENRERLDALAEALLERETLDEDDAYAVAGIEHRREPEPAASTPPAPVSLFVCAGIHWSDTIHARR